MRVAVDCRKIADYGIGTYIRGLLRALVESGSVDLVALAPDRARALLPPGLEHVAVDAPHYSLRELAVVGRAADRAGADLFHAPHYVLPWTRCPAVVTIHDLIHLHQPQRNPLARPYARAMIGRAMRRARRVLTVSEAVRRDLIEIGCEERKIAVTPNGVGGAPASGCLVTPASGRADRPDGATSGGGGGAPYFLFVGNDKPHKNVGTLVEAAKKAGVRLVLAGAPFERYRGVESRGFVADDELVELYGQAMALVMPSLEEGFGLPAAEAMACGTAVITSMAPALVEVTGDAALHVDATSVQELAAAMTRLACDGPLRDALAARGVERARRFTWRACAEKTLAAYREALSES